MKQKIEWESKTQSTVCGLILLCKGNKMWLILSILSFSFFTARGMERESSPFDGNTNLASQMLNQTEISNSNSPMWEAIDDPMRYFSHHDKSTPLSFDQFKNQIIEILRGRKIDCLNQQEYLEYLQAQMRPTIKYEDLHPWFRGINNTSIKRCISANLEFSQDYIKGFDALIDLVIEKGKSYREVFNLILSFRMDSIVCMYKQMETGMQIPDTRRSSLLSMVPYDQFVAWGAIIGSRLYDEILIACYPHLTPQDLDYANQLLGYADLLKVDGNLLKFLLGHVDIPSDPRTVIEDMYTILGFFSRSRMRKTGERHEFQNERSYEPVYAYKEHIPKENKRLYQLLIKRAEKQNKPNDHLNIIHHDQKDFLPASILKFHQKKSSKPKSKVIKPLVNIAKRDSMCQMVYSTDSQDNPEKEEPCTELTRPFINPPKQISMSKTKGEKIQPPLGGWSKQDQERSIRTQEKRRAVSTCWVEREADDFPPTQFRPSEIIYLNVQANRIRQQILDSSTPPFTICYRDVIKLLQEIGIPIQRNGGSHAHIKTPGHNLKTIVDLHYGWTDKYGPGAIASLRTLLMNLGLDQEKYVKERREDQSS